MQQQTAVPRACITRAGTLDILTIVLFCVSLLPLSYDGDSCNYLYVLFPFSVILLNKHVTLPPAKILAACFLYIAIFIASSLYQEDSLDFFSRRVISFLLFMSIFSFCFIEINEKTKDNFMLAVTLTAVAYSLFSVIKFFIMGGISLGPSAKDIVGSQRYGFVLTFAFWIALLSDKKSYNNFVRLAFILCLSLGILLTFSRASIAAMILSFSLYTLWSITQIASGKKNSHSRSTFLVFLIPIGGLVIGWLFVPTAFSFFHERLFALISDKTSTMQHLADANTSEGTRIFIWQHIIDFIMIHPLTGSGFLGVWTLNLFGDYSGSAHNQYMDVLFRTGLVGLATYLLMIYYVMKSSWKLDKRIFWGLSSILAYGLFHETFKESQGSFLLTFMLGWMASNSRQKDRTPE